MYECRNVQTFLFFVASIPVDDAVYQNDDTNTSYPILIANHLKAGA